jgi:hypothetical protein
MGQSLGMTLGVALAVDFGIQWAGWAVASALQTEKFYDLLGSLSFLTLALGSLSQTSFAPQQVRRNTHSTHSLRASVQACAWRLAAQGGAGRRAARTWEPASKPNVTVLSGAHVPLVQLLGLPHRRYKRSFSLATQAATEKPNPTMAQLSLQVLSSAHTTHVSVMHPETPSVAAAPGTNFAEAVRVRCD